MSEVLFESITSRTLRLFPDKDLEAEILGLRTVQTASGWKVDHGKGGFSDRAMTLSMALQGCRSGYGVSVPVGERKVSRWAQYGGVLGTRREFREVKFE